MNGMLHISRLIYVPNNKHCDNYVSKMTEDFELYHF